MAKLTDKQVMDYIMEALKFPIHDFTQLVSMVILHFDIPDKEAKEMVGQALFWALYKVMEMSK